MLIQTRLHEWHSDWVAASSPLVDDQLAQQSQQSFHYLSGQTLSNISAPVLASWIIFSCSPLARCLETETTARKRERKYINRGIHSSRPLKTSADPWESSSDAHLSSFWCFLQWTGVNMGTLTRLQPHMHKNCDAPCALTPFVCWIGPRRPALVSHVHHDLSLTGNSPRELQSQSRWNLYAGQTWRDIHLSVPFSRSDLKFRSLFHFLGVRAFMLDAFPLRHVKMSAVKEDCYMHGHKNVVHTLETSVTWQ